MMLVCMSAYAKVCVCVCVCVCVRVTTLGIRACLSLC